MKSLIFTIRLNSLYSIRIPFTWQSALTYPVLPPSAIIGMLANALQRYKNDKDPLTYLDIVEENIIGAASRLLEPCIIKSYTTSVITKWEDVIGGKFTNALGRQFAYSRRLEICAIFNNDELIKDISEAIKTTPLTCGDSESPISIEEDIREADVCEEEKEKEIITEYPVPFSKETAVCGKGKLFLMHERCKRKDKSFPLFLYLVPIEEIEGVLYPSKIKIYIKKEEVWRIKDETNLYVIVRTLNEIEDTAAKPEEV